MRWLPNLKRLPLSNTIVLSLLHVQKVILGKAPLWELFGRYKTMEAAYQSPAGTRKRQARVVQVL